MTARRLGIWIIGAWGGVSATAVLGLSAWKRKLTDTISLVTGSPLFESLDLDDPASFVVGGHDIRTSCYYAAVSDLHKRSNIFDRDLIEACKPDLDAWDQNIRPGTVLGSGATISSLADMPESRRFETPNQVIGRVQADLREFRETHKLDEVVVVNLSSTEPPFELDDRHSSVAKLTPDLVSKERVLPASGLYAWAALDLGLPYINFTPSLGASFPAALELGRTRKTVIAGKDGKTGETLLKTVLAPMFSARNLRVLSWVGHNIFGNRDGVVLNDPENKQSKIKTKDHVTTQILGYKPQSHVSIEYISSLDDWKTAWDHIHFQGFLGVKMMMQFTWQGCDSILAAPLVLDLVRLTLFARRRGEIGVLTHLASFFKSPMGMDENDFFKQLALLHEYVRSVESPATAK